MKKKYCNLKNTCYNHNQKGEPNRTTGALPAGVSPAAPCQVNIGQTSGNDNQTAGALQQAKAQACRDFGVWAGNPVNSTTANNQSHFNELKKGMYINENA